MNRLVKYYNYLIIILIFFITQGSYSLSPTSKKMKYANKPVSIKKIREFVTRHKYIEDVYYNNNPMYPRGCRSFSTIISEELEKAGINGEIRYSPKRDHTYISVLAHLEDGRLDEVIIDYTANQCGAGDIAPVIADRKLLKKHHKEIYDKFWHEDSLFLGSFSSINDNQFMYNSYMEYIEIMEAVDERKLLLASS